MKKTIAVLVLVFILAASVFAATGKPVTLIQRFSYGLGAALVANYGSSAEQALEYYKAYQYKDVLTDYGMQGIEDYRNGTLKISVDEINSALSEYFAELDKKNAALAAQNLEKAELFLSENGRMDGVHTTASGLQYRIIRQGSGEKAKATDSVELDYELTSLSGEVLDSSYARGEHSTFPLNGVIAGFREGVMLMPMGSYYIFYIHPSMGYGVNGTGNIEPNSLLVFRVETYSISK